ncbi:hypothetical protein AOLI_G00244240 [Acnodon oligacanthus]
MHWPYTALSDHSRNGSKSSDLNPQLHQRVQVQVCRNQRAKKPHEALRAENAEFASRKQATAARTEGWSHVQRPQPNRAIPQHAVGQLHTRRDEEAGFWHHASPLASKSVRSCFLSFTLPLSVKSPPLRPRGYKPQPRACWRRFTNTCQGRI